MLSSSFTAKNITIYLWVFLKLMILDTDFLLLEKGQKIIIYTYFYLEGREHIYKTL